MRAHTAPKLSPADRPGRSLSVGCRGKRALGANDLTRQRHAVAAFGSGPSRWMQLEAQRRISRVFIAVRSPLGVLFPIFGRTVSESLAPQAVEPPVTVGVGKFRTFRCRYCRSKTGVFSPGPAEQKAEPGLVLRSSGLLAFRIESTPAGLPNRSGVGSDYGDLHFECGDGPA